MAVVAVEPEAPEVAELTDDTRKEIVALRESGLTLAELKARFPQFSGEQIRAVLPPANKREAAARQKPRTGQEAAKSARPVGGKVTEKKSEPESAPKPAEPRYVEDVKVRDQLAEEVLAARERVGRNALAKFMQATGSAVWRWEHGRIHPPELDYLREQLARITAGELPEPERAIREPKAPSPKKADLEHRIEVVAELLRTARGDKGITKAALVDSALAVLDPQPQGDQPTE